MATTYSVPLQKGQPQAFAIALTGTTYNLALYWLDAANYWAMDIADVNNTQIIAGVPLLPGLNLLQQYEYLNIAGQFWVSTDGEPDALPTFASLGDTTHLYYVEA